MISVNIMREAFFNHHFIKDGIKTKEVPHFQDYIQSSKSWRDPKLFMRFYSIFQLFLVMAIIYQSLKIRCFVLSFFHFSTGNLLLTVFHYFTVHQELRARKTIQEIIIESLYFGVNTIVSSGLLNRKPSLD